MIFLLFWLFLDFLWDLLHYHPINLQVLYFGHYPQETHHFDQRAWVMQYQPTNGTYFQLVCLPQITQFPPESESSLHPVKARVIITSNKIAMILFIRFFIIRSSLHCRMRIAVNIVSCFHFTSLVFSKLFCKTHYITFVRLFIPLL